MRRVAGGLLAALLVALPLVLVTRTSCMGGEVSWRVDLEYAISGLCDNQSLGEWLLGRITDRI